MKKYILYTAAASFLISVLFTLYLMRFIPDVTNDTVYSGTLTFLDTALLVSYTVIFLSLIFGILLSFLTLCVTTFLKKSPVFRLVAALDTCRMPRILRSSFITLMLLLVCISVAGFFLENKPLWDYTATVFHEHKKSNAKKDLNAIVILVDALRPDRLGCYGYDKQTSPHIDALARESTLFKNCYPQASWTKPSVASLLTSLYPAVHGVNHWESVVPQEITRIPEILQKAGYITYGCVMNPCLKSVYNYNQGFDYFDDYLMRDKIYYLALRLIREYSPYIRNRGRDTLNIMARDNMRVVNKRLLPWIEKNKENNFFMYLHCVDTHFYSPVLPPGQDQEDRNRLNMALYDSKIRFVDENIGVLFKKLKSLGIYDKTLIIVTADHGEAFGEHGNYFRGQTVYEEELRVPLIIKYPVLFPPGRVIAEPVMSVDIMPTIIDVLNLQPSPLWDGRSLLSLLGNDKNKALHESVFVDDEAVKAVIKTIDGIRWKWIQIEKLSAEQMLRFKNDSNVPRYIIEREGQAELYNLTDDPHERNNLVESNPGIAEVFRQSLRIYKKSCEIKRMPVLTRELDAETMQQLRHLGYLN